MLEVGCGTLNSDWEGGMYLSHMCEAVCGKIIMLCPELHTTAMLRNLYDTKYPFDSRSPWLCQ